MSLLKLLVAEGPATWNTPSGIAARSYRARLRSLTVPTLIFHDRSDFLWDLSQATAAYRLLAAPKRLYVHWSGGLPPQAEVEAWFEHYLAGGPKAGGGVVIEHEQDASTTSFVKLPRTRFVNVNLPGTALTRSVRPPGGPLETFGSGGSVTIRYSHASWKQVVASVSTPDGTVVTEGAASVTNPSGLLTIPLLDEMALIAPGEQLVVTLRSRDSEFGGRRGGHISVGRVTLRLSVLQRAVSR